MYIINMFWDLGNGSNDLDEIYYNGGFWGHKIYLNLGFIFVLSVVHRVERCFVSSTAL